MHMHLMCARSEFLHSSLSRAHAPCHLMLLNKGIKCVAAATFPQFSHNSKPVLLSTLNRGAGERVVGLALTTMSQRTSYCRVRIHSFFEYVRVDPTVSNWQAVSSLESGNEYFH